MVVLIGAVGFVVSCFLPYSDFDLPGMVTPSFYRLIVLTGGTATLERIGGSLDLFACGHSAGSARSSTPRG